MKQCREGHENPDNLSFCQTCGLPLPKNSGFPRWILIVAAILIISIVAALAIPRGDNNTSLTGVNDNSDPDSTSIDEKLNDTKLNASQPGNYECDFNFNPPAPIGGKRKGVVELGATGFNSFIVSVDNQKNWSLEKAEYGNSLVYDRMADNRSVVDGLRDYIAEILRFGVKGQDVHFVVSSGALKVPELQPILKGVRDIGYVANEVTAEEEGRYALECVLPDSYKNKAFVVDIGSGNTKMSWYENNDVQAVGTYGARYMRDGTSHSDVKRAVRREAGKVPSDKTGVCFIIGGIPFKMAQVVRADEERYTCLHPPANYTEMVEEEGDYGTGGMNIYSEIREVTNCENFIFDWNANFTIGFLISLPY